MAVLVTGGAGYIGSHTCVELLKAGYEVVVVDNLCNSCEEALRRVEEITGKDLTFYKVDILDREGLEKVFEEEDIDSVIHFAGLKAVGESVEKPLEYYHNNVAGTLVLCDVMRRHGVKSIVFSSSATVYGNPQTVPIKEDFPLSVTNPYGRTKLMLEEILQDLYVADPEWKVILLRYFNPIGAHESGRIGENPRGIPNNLMPYITQVAVGKLQKLRVFGNDYDTPDGTGVRDYIHVVDLAEGHVCALKKLASMDGGVKIYNLGTGVGYSVLEVVKAFEEASGVEIPYEICPRRAGDIPTCYADASLAGKELGWKAKYDIRRMCADSWRWQKNNPMGYGSGEDL
ncbi:MAG TPA: UDP-glucose 4-epimerase GalE [Candidatus Onthocola gallistercoris]|uniref:UDP-glucose 4-epimerase n=1 Tax=Candidatus Onthocola gallistercoris TaxID=2840876 RepID=A0A9D1HF14_9FIRM|nr:UDP-glucose 4-epimerase GalE [Candidatus Onthocola gallistercoris]